MEIKRSKEEIEKLPIRVFREDLGLTRFDVRVQTGITERTLADIEAGRSIPKVENLISLSRAYKKSLKEMLADMGLDTTYIPDDYPKNNTSQT